MASKTNQRRIQKLAQIKKSGYAIQRMIDVMMEGEQFVEFSDSPHAIYGAAEFHKNMINGSLFNAASSSCAELSKIRSILSGSGRSSGCEWQRQRINSAKDERTMFVLEEQGRKTIEELRRKGRFKGISNWAVDIHLEERWDGAKTIKRGGSRKERQASREARDRLAGERGLVKSRYSRGTPYFEAYIVVQCVDKGAQAVALCMRVDDLSNLDRFIPIIADKLRKLGMTRVRLLLDREFFTRGVIAELEQTKYRWIIPCRNTPEVKRMLAEIDSKGKTVAVRRMKITDKHGEEASYWLRSEKRIKGEEDEDGAGSKEGQRKEPHQRLIGFAMSHKSDKPRHYKKRWVIETTFAMVSGRRNKTSSTNQGARLLAFAYSLFMIDVWVMINAVFWRRATEYAPRMTLMNVLFMSAQMVEIREPKPPTGNSKLG